jgi:predicted transcriptional regulator
VESVPKVLGSMARRKSAALTDGELRIMDALWARGRATVGEVVSDMHTPRKPAYNTVLTMLRILEQKGYVTHEKEGRAFAYLPLVNREQARRSALSYLLNRFFDDSPELLVLNLLGKDDANADELRRIRELIAQAPPSATSDELGAKKR